MSNVSMKPIILQQRQDKSNTGKVVGGLVAGGMGVHYLTLNRNDFLTSAADEIDIAYRELHNKTKVLDIEKGSKEIADWASKNKDIVKDCIKSARIKNIAGVAGFAAACIGVGVAAGALVDGVVNHFKKK